MDAVEKCRERCWQRDWVVEFDIAKFFDSVPWDLLVSEVEAHADAVWVNLYVRRWLAAPLAMPDGSLRERAYGTPQGAPVSPVLANLFLHYAFDTWMTRRFSGVWFERYADDAVLHCVTERQADELLAALTDRMVEVGLRLHPDKSRIVHCRDGSHRGSFEHTAFSVPRVHVPRQTKPDPARQAIPVVRSGRQQRRPEEDGAGGAFLAPAHPIRSDLQRARRRINPVVAGWINYYGRFRPWELLPFLTRINACLVRWIRRKYKRLAAERKALAKMQEIAQRYPGMFAHWRYTVRAVAV